MGIKATLDKAAIDITAGERKIIAGLLKKYLPNTTVWAYGSRVKWNARPYSDLDLVAFASDEQKSKVYDLKEAFEESNLPYSVDIFIWDKVPENFRKNIKAEYAVVQEGGEKKDDTVEGWRIWRVQDFSEVLGGGTPKTEVSKYWNGQISWITPKDLSRHSSRYILRGERNISEEGFNASSAKLLPPNTVLLTTRAPVGYVAIAKDNITTNQGFRSLIIKEGFHPEYIYYLLSHNTEYLQSHATGSTFQELTGSVLKNLEFKLPIYNEQRAIAHILGTLDDKIELNRRMNETLEGMARALFKSWFIDFDPVHAKAALNNHSPLEGESASQGRSPQASRWGDDNDRGESNHSPLEGGASQSADDSDRGVNNHSPLEGGASQSASDSDRGENNHFPLEEGSNGIVERDTAGGSDWTVERAKQYLAHMDAETAALFPSTFGENGLPEGWTWSTFGDVCEIKTGKRPSTKHTDPDVENSVSVYGGNGIAWYTNQILFHQPFIITGRVGTLGTVYRVYEKCWVSDNALCCFPYADIAFELIYFSMKTIDYASLNAGSTQPLLTQTTLKNQRIISAASELISAFHLQTKTLFEKILENDYENKTLIEQRDTLLPKLISGEVRVNTVS